MKIEVQLSSKEYLNLMVGIFIKKPVFIIFGIIGFILAICFFFDWNIEGESSTSIYYLFFAFFFIFINPFIFYVSIKKQIYQNHELTENIIYEFNNQQINIIGETFIDKIPWEKIKKISEKKNWIFIQQKEKIMNFIPKTAFKNQLNEFRTLIHKKGF